MLPVAGVARAVGSAAASGAFTALGAPAGGTALLGTPALTFRTAPGLLLGGPAPALRAARAVVLRTAAAAAPGARLARRGPGTARALLALVTPESAVRFRTSAPSGTFVPGRAVGPAPSAVAARTVDRALGPATAAVGIPSSFGTHVVLDCLSRPVGLTIPWWRRGWLPPGGSVIRDLSSSPGPRSGRAVRPPPPSCLSFRTPGEGRSAAGRGFQTDREDVGRFFLLIVGLGNKGPVTALSARTPRRGIIRELYRLRTQITGHVKAIGRYSTTHA